MSTFNVLMVHGGEQGLDKLKEEILEVLPELEDRRNVKSTHKDYFIERILDEGKQFDAVVFTKGADISGGMLTQILHMKLRPREVVVIGKRKDISTTKETIFVVEKIAEDWKTNLYSLDKTDSPS
jgi:hypothetical protein